MNERDEWARFAGGGVSYADADPDLRALCDFHACDGHEPDGSTFVERATYAVAPGGRVLELLLYARTDRKERSPGMLFVHGGGWSEGTPMMHMKHCHDLAALGFVAATIRYRLWPEAGIPSQVEDAKAAVRWMRANASSIGLDPNRIAIGGGSAGGHLAGMVALTPGRFEGAHGPTCVPSTVQAAVLWYPAIDLVTGCDPGLHETVRTMCGEEAVETYSPITYVSGGAPPILSLTGDDDVTTTAPMIRRFHDELTKQGATNELEVLEGREHAYDFASDEWQNSFDRMAEFLAAHL